MKNEHDITLSVLMDNSAADSRFCGEHGLSFLIEAYGEKILMDTGAGPAFMDNAATLGISLDDITHIVLSHGHYDHAGGLEALLNILRPRRAELPALICHPGALVQRRLLKDGAEQALGIPAGGLAALKNWPVRYAREPLWLAERICFLGEIPRLRPELQALVGETGAAEQAAPNAWKADTLPDDSALAVLTPGGLALFAGCSHSGIVNIVEYARQVTGEQRIFGIYGGLHFKGMAPEALRRSLDFLESLNARQLFACHCSGDVLRDHPRQLPLAAGSRRRLYPPE